MPYSVPATWAYLEYPTAAKMNQYKTGLDSIYAQTGTYKVNVCVCKRISTVEHYYIVHLQRWLLYLGGGRILDPANVNDPVTLSSSGIWTSYDLSSIDWFYPGKLYQVQDVECCFEDGSGF